MSSFISALTIALAVLVGIEIVIRIYIKYKRSIYTIFFCVAAFVFYHIILLWILYYLYPQYTLANLITTYSIACILEILDRSIFRKLPLPSIVIYLVFIILVQFLFFTQPAPEPDPPFTHNPSITQVTLIPTPNASPAPTLMIPLYTMPPRNKLTPSGYLKTDVYTGPGTSYLRSVHGAAKISTDNWFYIYAKDSGWALIEYAVGSDKQRIGYIQPSGMISLTFIPPLPKMNVDVKVQKACEITDEPNKGGNPLDVIPQGETVTLLCMYGSYAYVEYFGGHRPMRGFILACYFGI